MVLQHQSTFNHSGETEVELMDFLLCSETLDYPWNPADPDTADYYTAADSQFSLDDWSEAELTTRSQSFFTQMQACWTDSPSAELIISPLTATIDKFGARVPQQWLIEIVNNVTNLAASNLEPVDRLVQSVQDLLRSDWAIDDLLVMARPYVYAMRCDPGVNDPNNIVRSLEWDKLSRVERAKLTILIAQYAIDMTQDC
jgi:hypothetical protein